MIPVSRLVSLITGPSGEAYNPFYIYGPFANLVLDKAENSFLKTGKRFFRISGRTFCEAVIARLRYGDTSPIPCPDADIFLFSDINVLNGRIYAQEAFYFLFDRLYESGKVIVLSSNSFIGAQLGFEDRIITQLQGCLACRADREE